MRSISTSKEKLVEITDLHLYFNLPVYRVDSLRSLFVSVVGAPFRFFSSPRRRLNLFEDFNLNIYEGDRLAIVGVNGTGKTSLCRCIAGIYNAQRGRILTRGQIRAIFDASISIQPELTGRENALLLAEFFYPQLTSTERQDLVQESLEFSELGEFVDSPVKFYSNGMNSRLCLSLISARPGDVLILDEVFDGADQFFREKISERILDMIQNSGAVVFISHSFDQIRKVCNRVVVLSHGKVIFDGDPSMAEEKYLEVNTAEERA